MPRNPSFPSAWAFVRFKARIDWLRFAMGIGYERAVDYPWIFSELELGPKDRLIDVGSGATVFPLFVRAETGATVQCIDYDANVLRLKRYARKCGLGEALDDGTLVIQQVSGGRLPFPDSAFDKLSCISTIEHTPDERDTEAMLELFRIVRKGGRLAFSVPIAVKHTDVFVSADVYERKFRWEAAILRAALRPRFVAGTSDSSLGRQAPQARGLRRTALSVRASDRLSQAHRPRRLAQTLALGDALGGRALYPAGRCPQPATEKLLLFHPGEVARKSSIPALNAFQAMVRAVATAAFWLVFLSVPGCARSVMAPPSLGGPLDLEPQLDPAQLNMPWPKHSHYKQPWRAWLETVPATRLRSGVGINYKWDRDRVNDAVELALLAQAGISRIRVEASWNRIDYDTLDLTDAARAKLTSIVRGARAAGIRPLILLNAHHGGPGPHRSLTRTVRVSAPAGSRSLQLDSVTGLQVGYTGLSNLSQYKMAEVLITAINPATGTVTLSKPLPVALAAGRRLQLDTLRYLPFYPPGTPQFDATAAGWLNYVRATLRTVTQAGVTSFDVEIWNELTFGSDFLGINAYYDPPAVPAFNYFDPRPGSSQWELARRTVAMLASEFPSVTPIWGFSNTSFFQMPIGDLPPGTRGQSYHPYFFLDYRSHADESHGFENNLEGYAPPAPPYRVVMPETAGTYLKTESLARLINPAARNARPPGSPSFAHVMTEFGLSPAEYGVADPEESQLLKAKTLLRATFFWLNKGLEALWFFEDVGDDGDPLSFDLVPESVTTLSQNPPNPDAYMTPALLALRTAFGLLAGTQPVATPRPLTIEAAATDGEGGGIVFPGDASHPPLTYQDVLAILPFQLDARTFVLATYVMSRNILEPVRPISFDVRIGGLNGTGAQVRYVDSISGQDVPAQIIDRTDTSLTLSLAVADYPYVLRIEE